MDKTISSKKTEEHPSQIISTTTLHPPSQPTAVQLRDPTQNVLFPFVCSRAAHRHSTTWTKLLFQQARSRHRLGCLHNPCPALKIPSHAQGWVSRPQEDTRGPPPAPPQEVVENNLQMRNKGGIRPDGFLWVLQLPDAGLSGQPPEVFIPQTPSLGWNSLHQAGH